MPSIVLSVFSAGAGIGQLLLTGAADLLEPGINGLLALTETGKDKVVPCCCIAYVPHSAFCIHDVSHVYLTVHFVCTVYMVACASKDAVYRRSVWLCLLMTALAGTAVSAPNAGS